MAPVNNQPIGKVFIVYGTVKAVSPAGVERILTPNSPIYAHERIVTGPDGSVSVALTGQQGHLDLGRMSDVLLDDDVYGGGGHEGTTDAVAQVEDIQTALQDENFDPTTDLPATAAGAGVSGAGAGARGGGRQVVVFTADQMEVLPDSGAETRGVSLNFLDPPPGGQPEESQAPIDTVPIVGHAELTFDEANLPDGTSPDAGSLVKGGSLADLGVSFGSDAPGILDFGNGQIITIDGSGTSLVVAGTYGDLTINGDGSWTYILKDNTLDHSVPGGTGTTDQVADQFTFAAVDSDGSRAEGGSVVIHILDDGPRLSVGNQAVDESTDLGHGVQGTLDFAFGADGAGSLALSAEGAVWDAASKTLTGAGNEWVLHVNDDGTYTFTQNDAMHHSDPTNPDDSLPITVTALVTDGDGDSVSKDFTITVKDDGPAAGHPQDAILANETGNHVTGNLDIDFGNDGPASSLALQLGDAHGSSLVGQAVVDDQGHALTSGGMQLIYEDDGAGGVHAVIAGTHDAVFSVSLDDAAGTYTVTMGPHALDAVQSTALFSGAGGGGNNASADFAASESLNVHVTATSSNGPDPDAAYVQWDSGGIGVNSGSGTEKYIGPNDVLTMEFQGGDGQSQAIESIHFTLTGLGQTSDGVQTYTEIARYVTYLNGEIVDQGTISGDADGRVDFSLQSTGAFDTITFEAANKSTWYQIQSITVDNDPSLSYSVLATDGDGDTARTDAFHVTFDADGNITGTDHSEVIAGSSGDDIIRGGGGDDVIDGRDGNDMIDGGAGHDHITGGAGADTFIDLEAGAGEVHDQTPLDHLVGSIGQHP